MFVARRCSELLLSDGKNDRVTEERRLKSSSFHFEAAQAGSTDQAGDGFWLLTSPRFGSDLTTASAPALWSLLVSADMYCCVRLFLLDDRWIVWIAATCRRAVRNLEANRCWTIEAFVCWDSAFFQQEQEDILAEGQRLWGETLACEEQQRDYRRVLEEIGYFSD